MEMDVETDAAANLDNRILRDINRAKDWLVRTTNSGNTIFHQLVEWIDNDQFEFVQQLLFDLNNDDTGENPPSLLSLVLHATVQAMALNTVLRIILVNRNEPEAMKWITCLLPLCEFDLNVPALGIVTDFSEDQLAEITPLTIAIYNGHRNIVSFFISLGVNVAALSNVALYVVSKYCEDGDICRCLLDNGLAIAANMSSEIRFPNGFVHQISYSPIVEACNKGNDAVMKEIFFRIMEQSVDHSEFLYRALNLRNFALTDFILKNGDLKDCSSAFNIVAKNLDAAPYIKLLLASNIVPQISNSGENPAFSIASRSMGRVEELELLLCSNKELDQVNQCGESLLAKACACGNESICKFLLARYHNESEKTLQEQLNLKDKNEDTPLIRACRGGKVETVALLLNEYSKWINIDDQNKLGNTALIEAVKAESLDIVTSLLKFDAKKEIRNKDNYKAIAFSRDEIQDFLRNWKK